MRRRLYFLLPHLDSARQTHNELLLARIEERHMHFLANDDVDLQDLPQATLLQRSDLVHGVQLGLIYGGVTGIFAGLVSIPVLGMTLQSGGIVVLAIAIAGALMGAWSASMVAVGIPNFRLKRFENALQRGNILMMLDVPKARVEEVTGMIKSHHPEADMHGVEPSIPAFP